MTSAYGLFQLLPSGRFPPFRTTERPAMAFKTDFGPPAHFIPPDLRVPGSTNAQLHELPVKREHLAGIESKVLMLPRIGIVGIVIDHRSGGAHFRVIEPNPDLIAYPSGCALWVSDWELYRAVEMNVVPWTTKTLVEYGLRPEGSGQGDADRWIGLVEWFSTREGALEAAEVVGGYDPALLTRTTHTGGVVTCEVIYSKNPLERP